ncbi:hypothetical protein AJ79_10222 [Helicocarpus griseus UAMH5409]|uniref:BZIP domain-containing protein n=1 Tax=Helicocarpus griseus UAMH5409 TaxID=1447875 RepID=A0A2B7WER2_9EURO|nr:hypothetical protein AJ79_10222 [Helicocarpus griseus UAMH5409]
MSILRLWAHYDDQYDYPTRLTGEDDHLFHDLSRSDSFGLRLSLEEFIPQGQTTATTTPTSPWLDLLDVNHGLLDQGDQSLNPSLLPPTGTGSQIGTVSSLPNTLSDAPAPVTISEYDVLYPYSKGDELDVDESLYLTNAQGSFEMPALQNTTNCGTSDYSHAFDNLQHGYLSASQVVHNQGIDHPNQQSQSQVYKLEPKLPSPPAMITTASSSSSSPNAHPSTPSSLHTTHRVVKRPHASTSVTTGDEADRAADKRRRNTLAARRFRQKQHDRVAELEKALEAVCKERDELKMKAARWEGEAVALRGLLQKKG